MRAILWLAAFTALASACAHDSPSQIIGGAQVPELAESTSAPSILDMFDLGGVDIPASGHIRPAGRDGVAVVGEGLWLRGHGFGRQPTVYVAGVVAPVLARTADGGVVVRVPTGTPAGQQVLQIRTLAGQAEAPVDVRRYAVVWNNLGQSLWLDASDEAQGPSTLLQVDTKRLPPVSRLAFSSDARVAYVVGPQARQLSVIDATATGGPAQVFALELEGKPVWALKTAALAPVLVALRDDDAIVLSTVHAARPPRSRSRQLPPDVLRRQPVAAAVGPDGRHLAVAVARGNQVALLSLEARAQMPVQAWLSLDDGVQAPPIRDLGFSLEGDVLWVLSGANKGAPALGAAPTILSTLQMQTNGSQTTLALRAQQQIQSAGAPTALGVSRNRPLPSGAAIRRPPSLAHVLVGALIFEGQGSGVFAVGPSGAVLVSSVQGNIADVLVEPNGHWAFAPVIASEGGSHLMWLRADGRPASAHTLPLWSEEALTGCWVEVQP